MPSTQSFSKKRAAPANDYGSDDGFVEDAPKSKKVRSGSAKSQVNTAVQKDDDGNVYWELSGKRRLQVSEFKGSIFVGVREFYEKDGKMLPGKKGIALSLEQYAGLIELLPQIEGVLKDKGHDVPRPDYTSGSKAEIHEHDTVAGDEDEVAAAAPSSKLEKYQLEKRKKNHEATSDEDDED